MGIKHFIQLQRKGLWRSSMRMITALLLVLPALGGLNITSAYADYATTWWTQQPCDQATDPGASQIGTWTGLQDCVGPSSNPDPDLHDNFDGTYTLEWECVDLVMRYMYTAFGVKPYGANGIAVASSYKTSYGGNLQYHSAGDGTAPQVGSVVSFNAYDSNHPAGHTAIVTASSVNSSGNGSITFFQQNAEPLAASWSITLSGWYPPSGSGIGSVKDWLNPPAQGNIVLTTGVNVTQNQGFIGGSITASYTVSNTGSQAFALDSLDLLAVDPNGTWVQLGHDNTTSIPASSSVTFNHTFADLGNGDKTAKGGSWTIYAEYTDTNGAYQIPSGPGNGYVVNENDVSSKVTSFNFDTYGPYPAVFYKHGTDGRFYEDDEYPQPPAHWSGWQLFDPQHPQPNNEYFVGSLSVAPNLATPVPQLTAFARAADGTIWNDYQNAQNVWVGWSQMPTPGVGAAGDIAITINPVNNTFEYYAVGSDGNVWHNYGDLTHWETMGAKPSGTTFIGNVAAIANPSSQSEDFFVTDTNGFTYHDQLTTSGWSGWQLMNANFIVGGNISVQHDTYGNVAAYVVGHDGQVYESEAPFTSWQLTYAAPSGVSFVGDVDAQSNLASTASDNLFVLGSDGHIYQNGWGYQWFPWTQISSASTSFNGFPMALVDPYGNIQWDLMIVGADGNIWHDWGSGWNNWASSGATG